MMENVMIDLETLGTDPGSAILSISAVEFEPTTGRTGQTFYKVVNLNSCIEIGLKIDPSTVLWWLDQSKEAQNEFLQSEAVPVKDVLKELSAFLGENKRLWGNSARFDLGLLESAYKSAKMPIPWGFYNEMDLRTLSNLFPEAKNETKREGTAHNPVDDCLFQIKYCAKIFQILQNQAMK